MPAAPGATPRKMLPPPITTPISTPSRDTCAISATMFSIVWRLMPNGSSPIRASPESLSRIRLYSGVTWLCRLGERDVHGQVLAHVLRTFVIDEHADFGAVQIERKLAFRLHALEAPQADVLADLLHQRLPPRLDLAGGGVERSELLDVRRCTGRRQLGKRLREAHEVLVLGDEVGLRIELDQRAHFRVRRQPGADPAFGGDAAPGPARP